MCVDAAGGAKSKKKGLSMMAGFPVHVLCVFGGNRAVVAVIPVSFFAPLFTLIVSLRCKELPLQIPVC